MRIAHNLTAMNSQRQLNINTKSRAKSVEKLSSGFRINRSADDAAGLAISEKMRRQIRGLTQASKNVQDGISFCQVADGALHEVDDMLHRINELSVKAANGTNTDEDREYMDKEVQQIKDELTRIFKTTDFNGIKIFRVPYSPEIKGNTNDFPQYNIDAAGKSGGMILEGQRYTWHELGIATDVMYDDGVGNYYFKEDTTIKKTLSNGETLELKGYKDTPLESVSRVYKWSADASGITVNDNTSEKILWSQVKNVDTNQSLNPSNLTQGTYNFSYHGMTISFETDDSDSSIDDVINGINGSGANSVASWYTTPAGATAVNTIKITSPAYHTQKVPISPDNREMFQDTGMRIYANDDGVGLVSDHHSYDYYSFKTWEELGIKDWGISDMTGTPVNGATTYHYAENEHTSGIMQYNFTIAAGASKQSVINALNGSSLSRDGQYVKSGSNSFAVDGNQFDIGNSTGLSFEFVNLLNPGGEIKSADVKMNLVVDALTNDDPESDYKVTLTMHVDGSDKTARYEGTITKADYIASLTAGNPVVKNLTLTNGSELLAGVSAKEQSEHIRGIGTYNTIQVRLGLTKDNWGKDYSGSITNSYTSPSIYTSYGSSSVKTYNKIFNQVVEPPRKMLDIQAGADSNRDNVISIEWSPLSLGILGMSGTSVASESSALATIDSVANAFKIVNDNRIQFGAYQNRLEHTVNNLENVIENTTAAESTIRDTNMTSEMVKLSMLDILIQAGQSMLAQANQIRENIISLLS